MKRTFSFCVVFIFLSCILFSLPLYAQEKKTEKILSFNSHIKISPDASMVVTETIKVRSTGAHIKHGIYRDFPTRYKDKLGNRYVVDFKVSKVLRDGKSENYHFGSLVNGRRLYIGKKDVFLPAGEYTYAIVYQTNRQLGFFKDFDELYWNVTGCGWSFPIESVLATVELPGLARDKIIRRDGYTGPMGSKDKKFSSYINDFGDAVFTTTAPLAPKEGLTIVVSWPKGYVTEPTAKMKAGYFFRDNRGILAGIAGLLIILFYYLFVWTRVGKDPAKGVIIPLYNPPENFSPASVRYLMKMGFDNKAFTAAVIDMAVKGYLKIKEKDKVFTLTKTGAKESVLSEEEAAVASKLFGYQKEIKLENKNHLNISKSIKNLKNALKNKFEKIYFFTNKRYFIIGLIISVLVVMVSGALECKEKLGIVIFMCIWLTGWSVAVIFLIRQVIYLWRGGPMGSAIFMTLFMLPFVAGEFIGIGMLLFSSSISVIVILIAVISLNCLFYHLLKAPTISGRKIMDKIEGFKMYLAVAEKERLNILNPPKETPELFEKYLPYALALDVEQAWAQRFSGVFKKIVESGGDYCPNWYSGVTWRALGPMGFSSGLSNSLSGAISSSSVAPGSHSGGGGGGFSGGGGGGGGGGGW